MKKLLAILSISVLIVSCGQNNTGSIDTIIEKGDLNAIRTKRSEIVQKQQEIAGQLSQLDQAIASLDTLKKLPLVTTITARDTLFNHYLELQGSVETKQNLVIFPEMGGILTQVYVKEGQNVSKGQILARIDDGGLGQQLSQVEVQKELAKTTFERQKRLWEQKIGSEIQYLQAKTNYEAQNSAVEQIKRQLAKTTVVAPFSGTIDDIITEQGSVVGQGQSQLFRIVNLQNMYIKTDVPERYVSNITSGKDVKVEFPILGKSMDTKVRQAGSFINPANRTFKIEVPVSNQDKSIKPNLTAKLKINDYTNDKAILIKQSIISENAKGQQYVYIVTDKSDNKAKAKRVIIETGKIDGDYIEVLSGLKNGDEIIDSGARMVKDGQEVKIRDLEA